MCGAGKTMAAIILLARALAQGASGFIIDRAGHFEFLRLADPRRERRCRSAARRTRSTPGTSRTPRCVAAEKIDYLLALHALLLGEHHAGTRQLRAHRP